MGKVVILGKQLLNLNTSSGKISLNKQNISIEEHKIAEAYSKEGICVLKPIIDKLIIEYDLQDIAEYHKADLKGYIAYSLKENIYNRSDMYKQPDCYYNGKAQYKNYNINMRLWHEPSGQYVLIQADPNKKKKPFLKFDLNPSLLGVEGVIFFKKEIERAFYFPDAPFLFKNIWALPKTINRLDIAVDILGADVSDMRFQYMKKQEPVASQHQIYTSTTGRKQTVYTSVSKNHSNKTYFYNKKAELLNPKKNKPSKAMYKDVLHTRFEHRTNTTIPMNKLHTLINHLKKGDASVIYYGAFAEKHFSHKLFMQYAIGRSSAEKALEMIPDEEKDDYADTYHKSLLNIWNPEKLWSYWPEILQKSGLF